MSDEEPYNNRSWGIESMLVVTKGNRLFAAKYVALSEKTRSLVIRL